MKKARAKQKLKHWQGYGKALDASREHVSEENGVITITILVSGNHEYGICTTDTYRVFDWLLKRFDESLKDVEYRDFMRRFISVSADEGWDSEKKCDTCCYTIKYREE